MQSKGSAKLSFSRLSSAAMGEKQWNMSPWACTLQVSSYRSNHFTPGQQLIHPPTVSVKLNLCVCALGDYDAAVKPQTIDLYGSL